VTGPSNEALARAIAEQQVQTARLGELVNTLATAGNDYANIVQQLQQQVIGFRSAFQIFAELVMSAAPEVKQLVAVGTIQILERPDLAEDETLREMLSTLNAAATSASRTSPEGRRANFQVVPSRGDD